MTASAPRFRARSLTFSLALVASTSAMAMPQPDASTLALKKMSLDELMNLEVTSVSRSAEQLQRAAAAIAVVSSDDIERMGATSIPEALRFVPGLHVMRSNSSNWAIASRGFSSSNSEKLLVLSDTRSIYTPLFSGVAWDVQEYFLSDIERIEVIRGPGASLWGSNAVNGVINITTKNARDTQGTHLEAALGTEERLSIGARYGGEIGNAAHFRVYAKHAERDDTYNAFVTDKDDWRMTHVGFRGDWEASNADTLTLQGATYRGEMGMFGPSVTIIGRADPVPPLTSRMTGGNVLARWQRRLEEDSSLQLRFYYDRTHRDNPNFHDDLDTYDLDLQHSVRLSAWRVPQDIVWGLNYRYTYNSNRGKTIFELDPDTSSDSVVSAFVQDQLALTDAVRLTVGSKFEYNDYSGFELQPSIRTTWNITPSASTWAAVSRAVRVPTRLERDIAIDLTDDRTASPVLRLLGNKDIGSEELIAYELGARWQFSPAVSLDLAAFEHRYEGLMSLELATPFVDARDSRVVVPISNRNLTDGDARGIEALLTFMPTPVWRLTANYAYIDLELEPNGQDLNRGELVEGATPRHQWGLRSSFDLGDAIQLDLMFRSLSAVISSPETIGGAVPGYSELDVRVAWQATEQLQVSVVGQNLLNERHVEFGSPDVRGEIERGVYGKISWDF